ncbi:MAG: hypothetical protein LBT15_07350 [Synergistaceae bacterium]|jgi:hypothetical protein|nr:hypothetical protein [Synergistaceae bacterium]
MKYDPCDYPTMRELYKIKEEIYESQKGMTLEERFEDTNRRGEEALVRLGLADTAKRLSK